MKRGHFFVGLALALSIATSPVAAEPLLRPGATGHFLETQSGEPFFWLGEFFTTLDDDTAGIFHHMTLAQAEAHFQELRSKGFTVVHGAIFFQGSIEDENSFGEAPLIDRNPTQPNPKFFDHVDDVLALAKKHDLVVLVNLEVKSLTSDSDARAYGKWLGQRYGDTEHIIWQMAHDWSGSATIVRAAAEGLVEGATGMKVGYDQADPAWDALLMTLATHHESSSATFHGDAWLDINGHETWNRQGEIVEQALADYALEPPKPAFNGEPAIRGYKDTLKTRRFLYQAQLSGAMPSFWPKKRDEGPDREVARVFAEFFLGLPHWTLVPTPELVTAGSGSGELSAAAAISSQENLAVVYVPEPRSVTIDQGLFAATSGDWYRTDVTSDPVAQDTVNGSFQVPSGWTDGVLVLGAYEPGPGGNVGGADGTGTGNGSGGEGLPGTETEGDGGPPGGLGMGGDSSGGDGALDGSGCSCRMGPRPGSLRGLVPLGMAALALAAVWGRRRETHQRAGQGGRNALGSGRRRAPVAR